MEASNSLPATGVSDESVPPTSGGIRWDVKGPVENGERGKKVSRLDRICGTI